MIKRPSSPTAFQPLPIDPVMATFDAKWPGVRGGFQPVPNALLLKQHALGLTPIEVNLLLQITLHRFAADRLPYPTTAQLARRLGVTQRYVNSVLRSLERKEFLKRLPKRITPSGVRQPFDVDGLVARLRPLVPWEREDDEKVRRTSALRSVARAL